jgi:hypothetical protein
MYRTSDPPTRGKPITTNKHPKTFWCKVFGCKRSTIFPFTTFWLFLENRGYRFVCGQYFCQRCGNSIYFNWDQQANFGINCGDYITENNKIVGIELVLVQNSVPQYKKFYFDKTAIIAASVEDFSKDEWLLINTGTKQDVEPFVLFSKEKILFDAASCKLHSVIG